jgi:uncharacterized membrane protein YadS
VTQTGSVPSAPADAPTDEATRAFSTSILISAVRCTLSYVVFPWILPLLHVSDAVGPWIGLPIGAIAIVSNVASIRRFWRADHRWKWPVSVLNVAVLVLVTILVIDDVRELVS